VTTDFNTLIKWVENTIQINKELAEEKLKPLSRHEATFFNNNVEKLTLIKKYLNDYEKLAKDYHELDKKHCLLKLKKMELNSHLIFEDMKKQYRANSRKWRAKI
jgi:hypothetical protein